MQVRTYWNHHRHRPSHWTGLGGRYACTTWLQWCRLEGCKSSLDCNGERTDNDHTRAQL